MSGYSVNGCFLSLSRALHTQAQASAENRHNAARRKAILASDEMWRPFEPGRIPVSCSVPEGHLRIARRFNAGDSGSDHKVPKGRLNASTILGSPIQPSLRDSGRRPPFPALKRRAIFKCPSGTARMGIATTHPRLHLTQCVSVCKKLGCALEGRDPGAGHGSAENKYGARRRANFFARNLLGVEPRR